MEEATLYDFDLYLALGLIIHADHPVKNSVCIVAMLHMIQEIRGCHRGLFLVYFHYHIPQVSFNKDHGCRSVTGESGEHDEK